MREIDVKTWKRKSHYEWFSTFANPCFALDVRMDVTNLLAFCREQGWSSFAAVMYAVCRSLNHIQAFRYRVLDGKVYEIPYANAAYTVSVSEDLFVNNRTDTSVSCAEFCRLEKEQTAALRAGKYEEKAFNDTAIVDDIYLSCLPWLDFCSAVEPIPSNRPESSSIPRVCWGKYVEEQGRMKMTVSMTASHALVDGQDMAMAFRLLQRMFDQPEEYLGKGARL